MLRRISCLMICLALLAGMAAAEPAWQTVDTGHFVCALPDGWTVQTREAEDYTVYYGYERSDPLGGDYVFVMEQDYSNLWQAVRDWTPQDICEAYATGILELPEDARGFSTPMDCNGQPCFRVRKDTEATTWLITCTENCILALAVPDGNAGMNWEMFFGTLRKK